MSNKALDNIVKEIEAYNISARKSRLHRGQRTKALDMLDGPTPPMADSR